MLNDFNCDEINYHVIRSNRQTLALEIQKDLSVLIRSPTYMAKNHIDSFIEDNNDWIIKHIQKQMLRNKADLHLTEERIKQLKTLAKVLIPQRVDYFSQVMGLMPSGVKITSAQKRYGSCSTKNQLCFSWRLMLYKSEIIDCIVIHELAHIRHRNHSAVFYDLIECYLPDYRPKMKILKSNPAFWLR
jgi:predicted metal-dependent hydrolase